MSINKKIFKESSFFRKVFLSIKTINPSKSFFMYLAVYGVLILLFLTISNLLKSNYTTKVPKYEEALNVYSDENIKNVLPPLAENTSEIILSKMLFAGLIRYQGGEYFNDLAQNVEYSDDGLTVGIEIRPDAKFSNGDQVTSDDVIYSYSLMQDYNIDNRDRAKYDGMNFTKVDDKNLTISLKRSYSQIQKLLTLGIVNKKELSQYQNKTLKNIMFEDKFLASYITTSGQFRLSDIVTDKNNISYIKLKNNNNYYHLSYFKDVNLYLDKIADTDITSYFQTNSIDISFAYFPKLEEDYNNNTYTSSKTKVIFFNPNKNQLLAKKEDRQFLYDSIDRYYLANNVLGDYGYTTYDILPMSQNDISSTTPISIEDTSFEPVKKETASDTEENSTTTPNIEVEYKNLTITFLSNNDADQKIFNYLKEIWSHKNINLIPRPVTQDEMQNVIKNRDYELLLSAINLEDYSSLYSFFHSSQKNAPGLNLTNYVSKTFDQNIETLRRATSSEDTQEALNNIRKEFYKEYPYIPLYSKKYSILIKKNIDIKIDEYISNDADILDNFKNAYKETEPIYNFLTRFNTQIIKINKIIN